MMEEKYVFVGVLLVFVVLLLVVFGFEFRDSRERLSLEVTCAEGCRRVATVENYTEPHEAVLHERYCTCFFQGNKVFSFNAVYTQKAWEEPAKVAPGGGG